MPLVHLSGSPTAIFTHQNLLLQSSLHQPTYPRNPQLCKQKGSCTPLGTLLRLEPKMLPDGSATHTHTHYTNVGGKQACVAGASPCCCQETAATRCPQHGNNPNARRLVPAATQHALTRACLSAGLCACLCTGRVHSSCRWCCCCEQALTPQSATLPPVKNPTYHCRCCRSCCAAIPLHDTHPLSPHMRPHLHAPYWPAPIQEPTHAI